MNFSIDVNTGILALIIGHFISAILGVAYWKKNKNDNVMSIFLLSRFFDVTAWIFIGARGAMNEMFSIIMGNSMLIIGSVYQIKAILTIKEVYSNLARKMYFKVTMISLLGVNFFSFILEYPSQRVGVLSLFVIFMWLYPCYVLIFKNNNSSLQRIIAAVYTIGAIPHIYNTFMGLIHIIKETAVVGDTHNIYFSISLYVIMLVGNIGVILMSKEKIDNVIFDAATYDELTHILNRRSFCDKTENRISYLLKRKKPISFMIMDLDNFKRINDTYGHHNGDSVIKDFAQRAKNELYQDAIFGRFGGEEFTIALPEVDEREAFAIAQKIRNAVSKAVVMEVIRYTVSIGVVTLIPDEGTNTEVLYKLSDQALYKAKANGRNRVEVSGKYLEEV